MQKIRVLFVCMGNICRSPTAEGVFVNLLAEHRMSDFFEVDSAGTHAYHVGEAPDIRAQRAAKERGVDLSGIKARKVIKADFEEFDYILAMDDENFTILAAACPDEHQHKISLLLQFAPQMNCREVPDPYYGGQYGFERVLDLVEAASEGFLQAVKQQSD